MDGIDMWIYGDSLSTGTHGKNAYLDALKEQLPVRELRNFAVGSSGLTEETPNSMIDRMKRQLREESYKECSPPQLVLIWHGTNDWYWGSAPDRFREDALWAADTLRQWFPETLPVWCGPIFRLEAPDGGKEAGDAWRLKNKRGHTLLDYWRALEDCSQAGHFPLLDMNRQVNIHMGNEGICLEDHVHPNEEGYRRIARVLIKSLKELTADL